MRGGQTWDGVGQHWAPMTEKGITVLHPNEMREMVLKMEFILTKLDLDYNYMV